MHMTKTAPATDEGALLLVVQRDILRRLDCELSGCRMRKEQQLG
jgi:hypothetical protein